MNKILPLKLIVTIDFQVNVRVIKIQRIGKLLATKIFMHMINKAYLKKEEYVFKVIIANKNEA